MNDVNHSDIDISCLQEGYFWLDNSIIKGFDKQGNIHKFFRVKIDEYMNVNVIVPKNGYDNINDIDIASWQDVIELQKHHLKEIESKSLRLIKEKHDKFSDYTSIIPISTGKDSYGEVTHQYPNPDMQERVTYVGEDKGVLKFKGEAIDKGKVSREYEIKFRVFRKKVR